MVVKGPNFLSVYLAGEKSVGTRNCRWTLDVSRPFPSDSSRMACHSGSPPNPLHEAFAASRLSCLTIYTNVLSERGSSYSSERCSR